MQCAYNKIGELDLISTGSLEIIRIGEKTHNEVVGNLGIALGRTGRWLFFQDKDSKHKHLIRKPRYEDTHQETAKLHLGAPELRLWD